MQSIIRIFSTRYLFLYSQKQNELPTMRMHTALPVIAKPVIDTDLLFSIHPELLNDSFIYIHCHLPAMPQEMLIRIWSSTYLIGKACGGKSKIIHAENISFAPLWTLVPENFHYHFLLIFESLPRDCKVFDLLEDIAQDGGFFIPDIRRNESDVYQLQINT
jgi:hypothetical protein